MTPTSAPRTAAATSALRLSRIIGLAVVGTAAVVILGWILDVRILRGFPPGLTAMKVDTALAFLLAGYGLSRMARERPDRRHVVLAAACATAVCAIASLTILEHVTGIDLRIDQVLVRDAREDGDPGAPGRMAAATAVNFMLVGLALLCLASSRRALRIAGQAAAVLAAVASLATMALSSRGDASAARLLAHGAAHRGGFFRPEHRHPLRAPRRRPDGSAHG